MSLNVSSIAAAVGASVRNVQFASEVLNLARKILVIGTHDPAKTSVVPEVPVMVTSAEDAGSKFGFGSMIHRLVKQAFVGGQGIPVWVCPQAETGGSAASGGSVNFTGSSGVAAGTLYLYIADILVRINVAASATAGAIATAVAAAINADKDLPVTAAVDGSIAGKCNITAKSKGPWGDDISIELRETLPAGVTAVITAMSAGSGVPDIADALDALGTGDSANEAYFTDVVHGYGQDSATLTAIATYVGSGNDFTGLYAKTVARPFRCLTGDTAAGSQGLTDLTTLTGGRKTDRANGVIAAPGAPAHPSEIAAQAIGHMARIAQDRVAQNYIGIALIGFTPGDKVDRWTDTYDNRDIAVKAGISPVHVRNGVLVLQNVVSFYRPDDVPVASNGYRSMRNIAIIQNMLAAVRSNFDQEKWQGISIVADTTRVSNTTDRQKARDIDSVKDDLVALAKAFEQKAWIYEAAFTINHLKLAGAVTIRPGGLGFDSVLPVIFSGEGGILDTTIEFDTSLAVLFN